jgi:Domain of unknown function (DUF4210)/Chromosome segregation during meiosis
MSVLTRPTRQTREQSRRTDGDRGTVSPRTAGGPAALLPAIQLKGPISPEQAAENEDAQASNLQAGRDIRRPPSALHTGDFTQMQSATGRVDQAGLSFPWLNSLEATPSSPSIDISPPRRTSLNSPPPPIQPSPFEYAAPARRPRAPSYHSFSSFVYKPPTSPLVQQENNDDLDVGLHGSTGENRRRTLPADGFHNLRSLPSSLAQAARQPGSFQTDLSFLSQSREARRSAVFSNNFLGSVSPPTPGFLRSRRTSFSGEGSPLQPSSMVGSYEESILRGRMSTTPSKPVDFTAQIGALGKGNCKPKFPDHVTLSFPAVFYNWNTFEPTVSTEPSPYVGQIDLEHGLLPPKRKERQSKPEEDIDMNNGYLDDGRQPIDTPPGRTRRRKRSISPSKRPAGGSYRLPQQGQLQILIKNPNKTAVKLFLIPYDLEGMEPGTKTFIRQNSYSAGPIIDTPAMMRTPSESPSEAKPTARNERATLRYSIHLHMCCPAKGRYYLYKSIKVVFANRVPDNKERLRNEIRLPEPRFSPYRPSSEILSSPSMSSLRMSLDKENRRSSYQLADSFESMTRMSHQRMPSFGPPSPSPVPPVPTIRNFSRPTKITVPADSQSNDSSMNETTSAQPSCGMGSMSGPFRRVLPDRSDSLRSNSSSTSTDSAYNKLNKGDIGYGGLFARPGTPECSEGLLSRKLRTVDSRGSPTASRNQEAS